jgi:hypothetical protein
MGVKRHDADQAEAENEKKRIGHGSLLLSIMGASDGAEAHKGSMPKARESNKENVKVAVRAGSQDARASRCRFCICTLQSASPPPLHIANPAIDIYSIKQGFKPIALFWAWRPVCWRGARRNAASNSVTGQPHMNAILKQGATGRSLRAVAVCVMTGVAVFPTLSAKWLKTGEASARAPSAHDSMLGPHGAPARGLKGPR